MTKLDLIQERSDYENAKDIAYRKDPWTFGPWDAWLVRATIEAGRKRRGEPVGHLECHLSGDATFWPDEKRVLELPVGDHRVYTAPQPDESHVERARRIRESWPDWKRDYKLLKDSEPVKDMLYIYPAKPPCSPTEI